MVGALVLVPTFITIASLVLRAAFLLGYLPPACGLFGIALDAADGAAARRLKVCTSFGAELDWHSDVAVAVLALLALLRATGPGGPTPPAALVGVALVGSVLTWAQNKAAGRRVSGAAFLVALVAFVRWVEGT